MIRLLLERCRKRTQKGARKLSSGENRNVLVVSLLIETDMWKTSLHALSLFDFRPLQPCPQLGTHLPTHRKHSFHVDTGPRGAIKVPDQTLQDRPRNVSSNTE